MTEGNGNVKSLIKGLGFCSFGMGANIASVDVKNGKLLRIRPFHYDEKYTHEQLTPWKIEAQGKEFHPQMKSLIPPFSLSYKKTGVLSQPDQIPP